MTSVFRLCSHRSDQPQPDAKLSATSTKEETEKVKLTLRPQKKKTCLSLTHGARSPLWSPLSPSFLQIRDKVGDLCLPVLSGQREEPM